jgi:hypothetical protein
MMHATTWAWVLLFLLGAYHGVNPAMGWLFAVALGLQKHSSLAVWQALVPIATGHIVAICLAVLLAAFAEAVLPLLYVKIGVVVLLVAFGVFRIAGKGHARWGGMQVGFRDLTIWSFLMASAHGAGLMLLPIVLSISAMQGEHAAHANVFGSLGVRTQLLAVSVHTCGYLLLTGLVAWVVYAKLGVSLLRTAWLNLDRIWAIALIATAALTLFVAA